MQKLFTKGSSNNKTAKSEGSGYEIRILHLAPAMESGHEVCSSRSEGCTTSCLFTAGRGAMGPVKHSRIRKTQLWFTQRDEFKQQIIDELHSFVKRCDKLGIKPAVRMNGTSDLFWEKQFPELFEIFSSIQFYDYTKHYKRCLIRWKLPDNYHLTFSKSETNNELCRRVLRAGRFNVVAVFNSKSFPDKYWGRDVYTADSHDLRFLDPKGGNIGALAAKGKARYDKTGFVIKV